MANKRILSLALILALVLMLTMLPIRAEAATVASGKCGKSLTWTLDDKGTLTISGYGPMDDYWFERPWENYTASIKKITIGNSVTSIGDSAFWNCEKLTSMTIPNSVTTIGGSAFASCLNLSNLTIGNGVTSIGGNAFYNCSSLTSVTIPNNVITIGAHAFAECKSLTSVTIPNSVTSIGEYAFWYCERLTSVTIPNSVTSISDGIFSGCKSLTSVTIPNSATSIGDYAFYGCESLTSVTIPNSATSIGDSAFYGCEKLTHVTIPSSVTSIGGWAFYGCKSLTSVTIPSSVTSIGGSAFRGCERLTSVTIPSSVTSIGGSAFYGCERLTSVTIPNSVTTIGDWAFYYCSSLKSVTIGNGVTSIGEYAFASCYSLTSVIIPNSVTTIGDFAFYYCSSLKSVTIGKGVTTIGKQVFVCCLELTGIHVASNNPNYSSDSSGVLFDKQKTTLIQAPKTLSGSYIIPGSVTTIGESAFYWCDNLTSVTIPNSVTTIDNSAFASCSELTDLTIGNGVKTIGVNAFDLWWLDTVCYDGTQSQWNKITIYAGNDELTDADIHFNENRDHNCDTCGKVLSKCVDKNLNEFCDICGKRVPLPVPTKPHKIANVVSGVHVYWKAVPGVTKYGLFRSETGKNGTYKWVGNLTLTHYVDKKVESGKTYYYKVATLGGNNKFSEKSDATGITFVATPDITSRINKAAGITVGWNKIAGANGYAVYRKSYSGTDAWKRVATIEGNKTFTWQDTSVKNANGTAYKYTVRALAGSDMKTLSGCRNAGRSMVRLASRTISSAVKNGANAIKVSWNPSSAVTGYEVRFMVGSTVYKTFTVGNYKTGVKTFTGLKAGQTYKIQVRSYVKIDGMGFYSAWSEAKNVKLP